MASHLKSFQCNATEHINEKQEVMRRMELRFATFHNMRTLMCKLLKLTYYITFLKLTPRMIR